MTPYHGTPPPYCPACELLVARCICPPRPCTVDASDIPITTLLCPECGHWLGAHPTHNNDLDECLVCVTRGR